MCSNPNTRFLMRLIVDILLLTSVYSVALVILPQLLPTRQRGFFCGDESLLYPYTPYTVLKRLHITILVVAVPAAVVLCVEMLRVAFPPPKPITSAKSSKRYAFVGVNIPIFVSECYTTLGIYLFGLGLVLIVTTLSKSCTGRLAPYFFEACQPLVAANETACTSTAHFGHYIENYSCGSLTISKELLITMRQSFPSTHASAAAYAMLFMAIYLQARLQSGWLILWRTLVQSAGLLISLFVAYERVITYRHHWTDIMAGLVIGYFIAVFMTHSVAQFFIKFPIRVRRLREDTSNSNTYGYYTIMPRPRYC